MSMQQMFAFNATKVHKTAISTSNENSKINGMYFNMI